MSVKKVQCTNNHYFDGNKYKVCPICGMPDKEEKASVIVEPVIPPHADINKPDDKTIGLGDMPTNTDDKVSYSKEERAADTAEKDVMPESYDELHERKTPPSLLKQVEEVSNIDAKTTGRYTVEDTEPVVGWLVATNGASKGLSFEINDGKNSIGRMRTNKIVLEGEPSVSREKHAYIIFDAKNVAFYVQSGETDKMTYLNNSPVLTPQQLNPYDKIQLGDCELVFVPLCGEKFSWDNYIK